MDEILIERDRGVVHVTLNRPEKLNAQTVAMWHHLAAVGAELVADETIRVLVVAGAGRSFSAGIDISTFTEPPASPPVTPPPAPALTGRSTSTAPNTREPLAGRATTTPASTQPVANTAPAAAGSEPLAGSASTVPATPDVDGVLAIQRAFTWLEEAPYPTIAKVQGHAFGAGMQLALACDLRIAAHDVRMGLLEANWGLMPDLGGTVWLPRLVGPAKALELMMTAAKLRASELLALGIVNRVVPGDELDAEVDGLVAELLKRPPLALRGAKAAVRGGWGEPSATGMRAAAVAQLACLASADFTEAATAFLEGREPKFEGR